MGNDERINSKPVENFLNEWKRHPISFAIITILVTFSFLLAVMQGGLTKEKLILAEYTFMFSGLILLLILIILYRKREVLYNPLDLITHEIDHRISLIQESLLKLEIGIGEPYEEVLESLCPKMSKQDPMGSGLEISVFPATLRIVARPLRIEFPGAVLPGP